MQNNRKESLICLFRLFYFVSCGCIFLYLSQGLYQNFIGSKVILTISDLPIGDSGLMKPVIAICSEDPFRNYSKSMFTLKEYMNNSVNVTNDILMGYSLANFQGDKQPFVYVSNKRNSLFDSCSKISPQIWSTDPFVSCIELLQLFQTTFVDICQPFNRKRDHISKSKTCSLLIMAIALF